MKRLNRLFHPIFSMVLLIGTTKAYAASYNEVVDGDLSDNPTNPTSLLLDVGSNLLTGTMGSLATDVDFLNIIIPTGHTLDALFLEAFTGDDISFLGMQSGITWTEGIGGAINASNLLGWSHLVGSQVGTDILDDIGIGSGAQGFLPPLPSGNYTFLLQEISVPVDYSLDFKVSSQSTPIPEPSTLLHLGTVLLGLVKYRHRRK